MMVYILDTSHHGTKALPSFRVNRGGTFRYLLIGNIAECEKVFVLKLSVKNLGR